MNGERENHWYDNNGHAQSPATVSFGPLLIYLIIYLFIFNFFPTIYISKP